MFMARYKFEHATSIKKGDYIVIDDEACEVTKARVSTAGKHGHAKVNITAKGLLDDKKRNMIVPGDEEVKVPIISKRNAQVLSIDGDKAKVMDMETYDNFQLSIPDNDEFDDLASGQTVLYWQILDDKVMKEIK